MKEHPILFSGPMVRAILEGRKTQTRRVIKSYTDTRAPGWHFAKIRGGMVAGWEDGKPIEPYMGIVSSNPYGNVGDRLWVRETWHPFGMGKTPNWTSDRVLYRADNEGLDPFDGCSSWPLPAPIQWTGKQGSGWRPSIFMPRWASRLTLEITGVRVERVQDISEQDAEAEGIEPKEPNNVLSARWRFAALWNEINAKRGYSWDSNPYVWVVEFKRCDK